MAGISLGEEERKEGKHTTTTAVCTDLASGLLMDYVPPLIELSHLTGCRGCAGLSTPTFGSKAVARAKGDHASAALAHHICWALDRGQRSQPSSRAVGDFPLLFEGVLTVVRVLVDRIPNPSWVLGYSRGELPQL